MTAGSAYRGKRVLDLVVSSLLAGPALAVGAGCALAIRLEDHGPALFRQERIGRAGQPFQLLKFRTMRHDGPNPLFPDATRITRVGRVLRRLSLDELPQLVNVLRGEMSIVGPRPTLAYQVARYTPEQRRRLQARPGLTGLAQVLGRNTISWPERIRLDLDYLESQSLLLDLRVLLRSVRVVFSAEVGGHPANDPIAHVCGGSAHTLPE